MNRPFDIQITRKAAADQIELSGTIDAHAEKPLQNLPALIGQPLVRFDFSGVSRINSMGIAFLLRCFKAIREERQAEIRLTGLSQVNSMLFKMTGIFMLGSPE
ncbi:hypothetical protein GURASL_12350 [Geotalea uraniireducens]|uniref:STAS domain-containing protein n=1 Tax=Geotalea uraniireducens TaxID=351604 RepID=A0ABM8EJX7_9BACT|nr:STAS domain-containing protein [Geotalea uraniireducens]BDV42312.1 hypothetical protein GURASL_12350 [Geotalea uraniireducens]